eukprot:7726507-Alexandrium_andersonii.AAC.1
MCIRDRRPVIASRRRWSERGPASSHPATERCPCTAGPAPIPPTPRAAGQRPRPLLGRVAAPTAH